MWSPMWGPAMSAPDGKSSGGSGEGGTPRKSDWEASRAKDMGGALEIAASCHLGHDWI